MELKLVFKKYFFIIYNEYWIKFTKEFCKRY